MTLLFVELSIIIGIPAYLRWGSSSFITISFSLVETLFVILVFSLFLFKREIDEFMDGNPHSILYKWLRLPFNYRR